MKRVPESRYCKREAVFVDAKIRGEISAIDQK